jgi:hypothetical protein
MRAALLAALVMTGCMPDRNAHTGPRQALRLGCELEPGRPAACDPRWRAQRVRDQVDAPGGDATDWFSVKVEPLDCTRQILHAVLTWEGRRGDPELSLRVYGDGRGTWAPRGPERRRYIRRNAEPGRWTIKVDAFEGGAAAYDLLVYVTRVPDC